MEVLNKQIDLYDYLRVIRKHAWTIATVFAVVFVSVLIFTFTATPVYEATTRLIIEKDDPKVVSIQEVMQVDSSGLDYYQTQYKIIESRSVANEVIKRLNLEKNEEFVPKPQDNFLGDIRRMWQDAMAAISDLFKTETKGKPVVQLGVGTPGLLEPESPLVPAFLARVRVTPIRNSRLVDIGFQAKNPFLATQIANTTARAYIDLNLETKLKATQEAVNWLDSRINEERKKVTQAEEALLRYKGQHGIITDFSKDVESITAQKLAALNQQAIEAEAKRMEAETRYNQAVSLGMSPEMLDSIPELLQNDVIKQIKGMEVELLKRRSELSKRYGANHPQIVAIQNELETLQTRKNEEVKRVVNSLYNDFKVAQARAQSLKNALNAQKSEVLNLNQKAVSYTVLKREAESTREMYDLVIKRFKETSMTENIRTGNIRVVDPAPVPLAPVKPKKSQNTLLGLIMGLALGVGLAFFLEYLDNTIKVPDEVKSRLKIPYLGPVPVVVSSLNGDGTGKPEGYLITVEAPKSTASESYRGIRTSISFAAVDNVPHLILITSAAPGEGKTMTSANLAVTLAQAGSKVLILDCDMRRPKLHRVFNITRDLGVSNILAGSCTLDEAIFPSAIPGLDVVSSGPVPPNPSEILSSESMKKLLETVRGRYDKIIIDSPPLTAVTDGVILSRLADGVVLVVRAGETHRQIIQNGLGLLQAANAHILGAILNGVNMGRDSYYYYQYYYYYYGEEGEKKKRSKSRKKLRSRAYYGEEQDDQKEKEKAA